MVCKKIFMLAASVGIRHGSRRYGVCVDCADKSQPGGQEGADQVQDTDFPRDEEYEENEVGEGDEELGDDVEEQNDQSRWDEPGEVCMPLDDWRSVWLHGAANGHYMDWLFEFLDWRLVKYGTGWMVVMLLWKM